MSHLGVPVAVSAGETVDEDYRRAAPAGDGVVDQ